MKTVRIRKLVLFCFFLLTPVIQFYFSPFIPFAGAINGMLTISLFVFAALFAVGIFIGRAPCSWIMPCGGLQDACSGFCSKSLHTSKKDLIKYGIFAVWIIPLVIVYIMNAERLHLNLFYMFDNGISVSNVYGYIPYYSVLFTVVLIDVLIGKRAMCHYGCWISPFMILGRKLGNVLNVPRLILKADPVKCSGCRSCSKSCPMGVSVDKLVQTGNVEHSECIMCMECVYACKSGVIKSVIGRSGTGAKKD